LRVIERVKLWVMDLLRIKPHYKLGRDIIIKPIEEIEGDIAVEVRCVECGNPYQFLIRYEGRVVGYYCPGCGAKTYVAK